MPAPAAVTMTGGEAVVRALAAAGVELVFGIPGTHTLPIHRHLTVAGIRHVTPRHEQGGAFAADGYARVSGRPGVVLATSGPGVINTATAAATAYADSVPVLIVSPAMPTTIEGRDTGFLHESKDQGGAMGALTAWSRRARSPQDAADAIADAFAHFATARPRPVHVDVPIDVLEAQEPVELASHTQTTVGHADEAAVHRAAEALRHAERPAMILGGGARGAADALTALAQRLAAPVLTTVNGKGIVDERHPLSFGASIRLRAVHRWLAERDVILAVGTELGDSDWWGPPPPLGGRLIRVDLDPAQLHKNLPSTIAVEGDARTVGEGLLAAVEAGARAANDAPPAARGDLAAVRDAIHAEAQHAAAPFQPLVAALDQALGPRGVLAADSTRAAYYAAASFLPMDARRRFLYPSGYVPLGYGLPAAIGAKLAAPDRPVIALAGDGGLLFTISELVTAAELGSPLPVVVVNDRGYGEIRDQMRATGIEPIGVDLTVPDLPRLGEAFGGAGQRVDDPARLAPALHDALERPGPTLIEVPMGARLRAVP
jgi:acetolactate synthase I/II/III large subunit